MFIKVKLTFKLISLVKIKKYLLVFNRSMEKISFNYRDIYKIIYFYNILIVLVKPKREFPNTALETNCPIRKGSKINYYGRYKSFYWINDW